jgi:uncharacterized protein YbjT (DUF2867 family)
MIVVTAPTGQIGTRVLDGLLDSEEAIRVIARDPSRLPDNIRGRVEIIQGSHSEAKVADRAFAGADTVFWLVPADPRASSVEAAYVDFARPARDAIERHGVERVVAISALGRGTPWENSAGHVTATHHMDDMLAETGVAYRALTLPSFMDNTLRQVQAIKSQGLFFSPIAGDRKMPACATRDVGAVATRVLLDKSWEGRADISVLGPEDLSFEDMAATMSDVLGRHVRFQQIPGDAFKDRLVAHGMSEPMAQALLDMALAKEAGLDNAEPRTPEATTPTTFREWCEDVLQPALARV